jgi:cytosolic iron-sulfur protein assembly protein CIAO1
MRFLERRSVAGPRLISSSDDLTIRVWSREPRGMDGAITGHGRIPSSIRTGGVEEEWVEEAQLPQTHSRAIYSVAWSKRTGRVVSVGGDGKIVVYEERWRPGSGSLVPLETNLPASTESGGGENGVLSSGNASAQGRPAGDDTGESIPRAAQTEWVVLAEMPAAHGVYEINHVCWAKRFDKGRAKDEEIIISTGDDGMVKAWVLEP